MLKNYLKVALRNLRQQKYYTMTIILGLVIGLALFVLGVLYTNFHFTFDRFHKDLDRTYLTTRIFTSGNAGDRHTFYAHSPVYPLLKENFREIEDAVRYVPLARQIVKQEDTVFFEDKCFVVDSNFFDFFSFKLTRGNPETVLIEPDSVVITKSMAQKYYGDENPIGKTLQLSSFTSILQVTGVTEDIPKDSTIDFNFLVASSSMTELESNWAQRSVIFVKLKKDADPAQLQAGLPEFTKNHLPKYSEKNERIDLFPFDQIHLEAIDFLGPFNYKSESSHKIYFILGVSIVLLLVVCINFMNLSTARFMLRAKEVGLRKTLGASRFQLVYQFLGESIILTALALPLAIIFFEIIKPVFINLLGGNLELSLFKNPEMLIIILAGSILFGILSGSYPAFYLSRFKPSSVFREQTQRGGKGTLARKILVISQFSMAILLIAVTLVITKQFGFLMKTDLGYNRRNIITIPVQAALKDRLEPLRNDLLKHSKIAYVSYANWVPIKWGPQFKVRPEGASENETLTMKVFPINYDFIETTGLKVLKGRTFSREFNDENNFVISKRAASQLGWQDPLGKRLTVGSWKGTVVGMVEDFHFSGVSHGMTPNILIMKSDWIAYMFIKLNDKMNSEIGDYLQTRWEAIVPDIPLEYSMLEDVFQESYLDLTKGTDFFGIVSLIAIFISCMGLIGLSSYTVQRKTREIGVRKVFGATTFEITKMFVFQFLKWVLISNIIALPLAYLASDWFLNVAWVNRTSLGIHFFIIASLLSFVSALASVIPQTIRAANTNPTNALKYE